MGILSSQKLRGWLALLGAMASWAYFSLSIEGLSDVMTLAQQQAWRQYPALAILMMMALRRNASLPNPSPKISGLLRLPTTQSELFLVSGICLFLPICELCYTQAIYLLPVGVASVIVGVSPSLITTGLAFVWMSAFQRRNLLSFSFGMGLIICIVGFLLLNSPTVDASQSLSRLGICFALFSTLLWSSYTLISQRLAERGWSGLEITGWVCVSSVVGFTVLAVAQQDWLPSLNLGQWTILISSGIAACFVSQWLYNIAVKSVGSVIAGIGNIFESLIVITMSAVIFKEYLALVQIIGVGFLIAGALVIYHSPANMIVGDQASSG